MPDVARDRYTNALNAMEHVPLYANTWWLDATCGQQGWEILSLKNSIGIESAIMPFHFTRIKGLKAIITPPMTQYLPIIFPGSKDEFLFDQLFDALPQFSILDISLRSPYLGAYKEIVSNVQLRYSYVINAMQQMEQIRSKYNEGLRRNLRDAEKKYVISESGDVEGFVYLCMKTYQHRNMKVPAWVQSIIPELYKALQNNNAGMIKIATLAGKPIAGIMVAWDNTMAYYITGGRIESEAGASAHALLLDDAIRDASERKIMFDFEGSMHPGIANFFQSFGGIPERFWRIRKFHGLGKIWALLQS